MEIINYDRCINIASIIAGIGLIISAIGIMAFRYYSGKKSEQSFALAANEMSGLKDKVKTEFESTINEIQAQKVNINSKIEVEALSIIDELREKSKIANVAIESLRKESNKASEVIAEEVGKIKEFTEIQLPIKINGYIEVHEYINELILLLKKMYDDSVPVESPNNFEDFISPEYVSKSWDYLLLDSDPSMLPHSNYSSYLSAKFNSMYKKGDKILARYDKAIDSDIIKKIHLINEGKQFLVFKTLSRVKNLNGVGKIYLPKVVVPKFSPVQFLALKDIHDWCLEKNKEYIEHKEYDSIPRLPLEFKKKESYENPPNIAPQEILNLEINDVRIER